MSNNLAVKVSADVADLTSKFAIAKASVNALSSELNALAKQSASGMIDSAGTARLQQVAGDFAHAQAAAAQLRSELKEATATNQGFTSSLSGIRNELSGAFQFAGVGIAIAGITQLGDAIKGLGDRAKEMRTDAQVLGVTVEQFQALQVAAEDSGVSQQVLIRATETLVKAFDEARGGVGAQIEKLRLLGFTTDEINDKTFGTVGILRTLKDGMNDSGRAAAVNAGLLEMLGTRGAKAAVTFKDLDLSAAGVAKILALLNPLSDEQSQKLSEMGSSIEKAGTAYVNLVSKIALFIGQTAKLGPMQAGENAVFQAAADRQKELASAQAATAQARSGQIQRGISDFQLEQAAALLSANAITKADLDSIKERIAGEAQGSAARLALVRQFYQESQQFYGNSDVDKVREAHSQLLSETREYNAKQEQLSNELMHSLETDINHQIEDLKKTQAQLKKNAEETRKTADAELEATRESVIGQIALQKELIQSSSGGSGKGADSKAAAEEIALTVQELEAWEQFYQAKMALAQGDATAMATLQAQRYATEQKFNTQVIKLQADSAKSGEAQWLSTLKPIGSAFDSMISGMIRGQTTLRQSMLKLSGSLIDDAIKSATQIAEKWLAKEMAQTAATLTGNTVRTTSTIAAGASAKAASASTGSSTVMADAAKAFSGTYSSVAQIPYVGWILAPAAATAAYAAVAAYEGMASLAVGTAYVPRDMPAMLHQGEAVLPKPMAETMRQGGFGGAGGVTHNHTHNWNINAIDGPGVKRMLSDPSNRRMFQAAVAG